MLRCSGGIVLAQDMAFAMTAAFAATRGSPGRRQGGLSWLVPAFLLAIGVTANNPWILLVDI